MPSRVKAAPTTPQSHAQARGQRSAKVENVRVIYHQAPSLMSTLHYGGRLVWNRDGTLHHAR
jgi:glucose/arabinose dehydrogenase